MTGIDQVFTRIGFCLFIGLFFISQVPSVLAQSEDLPLFLEQALESEVVNSLPTDGARVGYIPLLVSDQSPLGAYYSRFLPQILLSRIPEIGERLLETQEVEKLLTQAAQVVLSRELEALHTHLRQGSRTSLSGREFIPSKEIENRARVASQELSQDAFQKRISQGFSWIPTRVRLSLVPPITERSQPIPEQTQDHFTRVVNWLGNEGIGVTDSIPSLFRKNRDLWSPSAEIIWSFSQIHGYVKQQNLQYTLIGNLNFFGDNNEFGLVEYWVYSAFSQAIVHSGRFSFASRSAPEVALEESRDLTLALTGQQRGIATFTAFPPTTEIRVAGKTLGFGTVLWDMAPLGVHQVQFLQGNRIRSMKEISVSLDEPTQIIVSIPPEPIRFVPLETNPPGAEVSFNGVTIGQTPLLVPITSGPGILEIRNPGFHTRTLVIDQEFREHGGKITLLDGRIDWDARLSQTRDRFYGALGFTVLTAAVPLVLNGLFGDAAVAFRSGEGSAQARSDLFSQASQLYWIRNGSYLLTGVTLAYTLIELQNYLRTARAVLSR